MQQNDGGRQICTYCGRINGPTRTSCKMCRHPLAHGWNSQPRPGGQERPTNTRLLYAGIIWGVIVGGIAVVVLIGIGLTALARRAPNSPTVSTVAQPAAVAKVVVSTPAVPTATTVTAPTVVAAAPKPTRPPTQTPDPIDRRLTGQTRYIVNTEGLGIRVRDACDDTVGTTGWPEGAEVTVEAAQAECPAWLQVRRADGERSWVRVDYLAEVPPGLAESPDERRSPRTNGSASAIVPTLAAVADAEPTLALPTTARAPRPTLMPRPTLAPTLASAPGISAPPPVIGLAPPSSVFGAPKPTATSAAEAPTTSAPALAAAPPPTSVPTPTSAPPATRAPAPTETPPPTPEPEPTEAPAPTPAPPVAMVAPPIEAAPPPQAPPPTPVPPPTSAPPPPTPAPPTPVVEPTATPALAPTVAVTPTPAVPAYEWLSIEQTSTPFRPRYKVDLVVGPEYDQDQMILVLQDAVRRAFEERPSAKAVVLFAYSSRTAAQQGGTDKGRAVVSSDGQGWTGDGSFAAYFTPPALDKGQIYLTLGSLIGGSTPHHVAVDRVDP